MRSSGKGSLFPDEGGETGKACLENVWIPHPGSVQAQAGQGFEQLDLVKNSHSRRVIPNPNHSMILFGSCEIAHAVLCPVLGKPVQREPWQ